MRKLFIYFMFAFLVVFAGVSVYYFAQIKGVMPAFLPARGDIADMIGGEPIIKNTNTEDLNNLPKPQNPFTLPAGFEVSIYAKDLGAPRAMHFGPSGQMLVSIPKAGKVVALIDKDLDGFMETDLPILENLASPHGIESRCDGEACKLYVAETDKVVEYDFDAINVKATNGKKLFDLPRGGGHSTRTIMFEPYPNHNKMLVSIGSSCNVCNEADDQRAKVLEYDFNTSKLTEYAKGLRNSVFMAIHPVNGDIWATEMGRDNLGNDTPPDEINILKKGSNYGWPTCYGKNIHDTEFDKNTYIRNPCMEPFETASHIDIPAHSAPLGLAFFPEEMWPEEYWYNALVAMHGSWNSTVPKGYKIVRYKLDSAGKYLGEEDFMTGFLPSTGGTQAYGRPVDIIIQPGGTIYISDDKAGVIYKVARQAE